MTKKKGVFLAALLSLFDDVYDTIGGYRGKQDLFLDAYKEPHGKMVIHLSSAFYPSGDTPVTALKSKHYSIGLTVQHMLDIYLKHVGNKGQYKGPVGYFVDPSCERESPSREIYILDDWVIHQHSIMPEKFFFESRTDIDSYLSSVVGKIIGTLMGFDEMRADMSEVVKEWEKEAADYYVHTKTAFDEKYAVKDKDVAAGSVASIALDDDRVYYASAGVGYRAHIIFRGAKVAICGMKEAALYNSAWTVLGISPGRLPVCEECAKRSRHLKLTFIDPPSSHVAMPAYYVGDSKVVNASIHLAPLNDSEAMCGATAPAATGKDKWEYVKYKSLVCSRCASICIDGGLTPMEHSSVRPLRWVKFPNGGIAHLTTTDTEDCLCGVSPPKVNGWTQAFKKDAAKLSMCPDCAALALMEFRNFPMDVFERDVKNLAKDMTEDLRN